MKDNVVMMALKAICSSLKSQKVEQIRTQHAANPMQLKNEMNAYRNQKQDVAEVLHSNTEFKDCFLYQKIKADLDEYIAKFN